MTFFRISLIALFAAWQTSETNTVKESLFQAIQRADTAAVERLLSRGLSPNVKDEEGTPALMAATLFAGADCLELLLKHGADPNQTDAAGATPLIWAVPDFQKVQLLIEYGANVNAKSATMGRTPLVIAASHPGSVNVLKLLVDEGADIHAKDRTGLDAFALATRSADVEVVRFLVENGIDPNEPVPPAVRSRLYARHHLPAIDYLMSQGLRISKDALISAASWQEPELIKSWIEMGADVNARSATSYNRTPLMTAASSERAGPATLRLLLDRGADPNAENSEGERPLDWAIYRSDQRKIEVLEQYGAARGDGPRRTSFPPPEPGGIADRRTSLSRSVPLLLKTAPPIFQNRGCVSCHNNTLPAVAAATTRRKGIEVDEHLVQKNLDDILAVFKPGADRMMQGEQSIGGIVLTAGYVSMALAAEGHPLDKVTAALTHWVAASQMPDGSWLGNGVSRPPMEESTISHTTMAVRALTLYPIPGRTDQLDERLRKAQRWLLAAEANSAEERGMRLMGLVWTDAPPSAVRAATKEILAQQTTDGGWSQLARLEPDAYATGLSLFALREAGVPVTDEAYRKGVEFLLRTQYQNGAWLVKTRAFPGQAYFESGFPFDRNQWISAAGTSWAALAIAHTLPDAAPRSTGRE